MATREVSFEKNLKLKCMQLKVLKSVTRIPKRDAAIGTDEIGRECLDRHALGM